MDDGWYRIETAPRDGTKFDAWRVRLKYGTAEHFDGERLANVWWGRPYYGGPNEEPEDTWVHSISYHRDPAEPTDAYMLTHWRPLPDPPKGE